ncbi:MAG: ABC transporter permease [Candidatus Sumerlaeaceae bacterium]
MFDFAALGVSTLRISMPYAAGALGGTMSERGGVVNIALEGLMLGGAFAFVTTSWALQTHYFPTGAPPTGSWIYWVAPLAGLLAAVATGVVLSFIHAVATVLFKADNIISGFAINIFSLGVTNFLLKKIFGSSSNSEKCLTFTNWNLISADSPLHILNQVLHPLILIIILMFALMHWLIYYTRFGLRLRAVGENPQAADSLGVNVSRYRISGVLLGGAVASLGGVWLASDQGLFTSNMTAGRGYIALAAMIIGKWRPWGAAAACLIFGLAEAIQNQMQVHSGGGAIPTQLIQAFPYLLTIIVIAGLIGRSSPPAADGIPYEKERE